MNSFLSRKLWFHVAAFFTVTALRVTGHIPPEIFGTLAGTIVISYSGGNVGEHFASRGKTE